MRSLIAGLSMYAILIVFVLAMSGGIHQLVHIFSMPDDALGIPNQSIPSNKLSPQMQCPYLKQVSEPAVPDATTRALLKGLT